MSNRMIPVAVWLAMLVGFAGIAVGADSVTIDTSGATSFSYGGRTYVPLKSVASFLDAPLQWDSTAKQAAITYLGKQLGLTPNSLEALFMGQATTLQAAPVVANGTMYVPTDTFRRFYGVPVEWDGTKREVRIRRASGWGTMAVASQPPWHGGPPPWAPAWGRRAQVASGSREAGVRKHRARGQQERGKGRSGQKGRGGGKSR